MILRHNFIFFSFFNGPIPGLLFVLCLQVQWLTVATISISQPLLKILLGIPDHSFHLLFCPLALFHTSSLLRPIPESLFPLHCRNDLLG
jgi:hypothetical protein